MHFLKLEYKYRLLFKEINELSTALLGTAQERPYLSNKFLNMQKEIISTFSVFPQGYRNHKGEAVLATRPEHVQTIKDVYDYIISDRARWATEELRHMVYKATRDEISDFKKLNFRVATFAGVFNYRNAKSIVSRSGYLVVDIDDLNSTEEARNIQQQLINDSFIKTALCFLSPKGRGVKCVICLPHIWRNLTFKEQFEEVQKHVAFHYGIAIDKSGSDVCRACFLPYDEECYINTELNH